MRTSGAQCLAPRARFAFGLDAAQEQIVQRARERR
jgi:hypothetical protein